MTCINEARYPSRDHELRSRFMARKTIILETFLLKKNHEFVDWIVNIVGFLIIRQIDNPISYLRRKSKFSAFFVPSGVFSNEYKLDSVTENYQFHHF